MIAYIFYGLLFISGLFIGYSVSLTLYQNKLFETKKVLEEYQKKIGKFTMNNPLMKCGHIANAKKPNGKPVCAICMALTKNAEIIADEKPDLKNRKSKCSDCGKTTDSNFDLPFFKYCKDEILDSHYCGCKGWN